jgi:hypothetical protein
MKPDSQAGEGTPPPAGSAVLLSKRDRRTILAALATAALWEDSLAEAWAKSKRDPAYGKATRAAARYRRLRGRLASQNNNIMLRSERSERR